MRASLCDATDNVLLCSANGYAVRFDASEEQLRASGRQSRGVKSMRMGEGDTIADMFVVAGKASRASFLPSHAQRRSPSISSSFTAARLPLVHS